MITHLDWHDNGEGAVKDLECLQQMFELDAPDDAKSIAAFRRGILFEQMRTQLSRKCSVPQHVRVRLTDASHVDSFVRRHSAAEKYPRCRLRSYADCAQVSATGVTKKSR